MSPNFCITPSEAFRAMTFGLVCTAFLVNMILKQKNAAKAKKPIPLTPKGIEITTYILLALQCLGMFTLIGAQVVALR